MACGIPDLGSTNKSRELKKLIVGTDHRDALLSLTLTSPLHDLVIWPLQPLGSSS